MKKEVELSNLLTGEKSKSNLLELKYEIICDDTFIFIDKFKEIMAIVLDSSKFE